MFPFLIIGFIIAAAVKYGHREVVTTGAGRRSERQLPPTTGGAEPAFQKPVRLADPVRSVDDAITDLIDQGLIDEAMMLADMYPDEVVLALPDGVPPLSDCVLPAGELEDIGPPADPDGTVSESPPASTVQSAPIKSPFEDITDDQWASVIESLKIAGVDHRDGKSFGAWRQPFTGTAGTDAVLPTLDSQRSAFSQWLGSALTANESAWRDLVGKDVELDGACVPVTRSGAIAVFRCAGKKVDRWLAGDRGRHTTEAFNNSNGLF